MWGNGLRCYPCVLRLSPRAFTSKFPVSHPRLLRGYGCHFPTTVTMTASSCAYIQLCGGIRIPPAGTERRARTGRGGNNGRRIRMEDGGGASDGTALGARGFWIVPNKADRGGMDGGKKGEG
jgi:hypothetical protein